MWKDKTLDFEPFFLAAAFLLIAALYAAVGQAGASGYLAVMALAGFGVVAMKTTALALNLAVAAIGTVLFLRAGRIGWRNVWPFAALGFPFSMLGGAVILPERIYFPIVGAILILSALQMARSAWRKQLADPRVIRHAPFVPALLTGAVIGFISGTTGTGGGVFLAPVILAMGWGTPRQTAATTAVYNLMNSAAALLGAYTMWDQIPASLPTWLIAVGVGGTLGAVIGSRYLSNRWLRGILALLLAVSGIRMLT